MPFCNAVSSRPGYCPTHLAQRIAIRQATYDATKRNDEAHAFYTSTEWRNCRAYILGTRQTCEVCKDAISTDVHHVKPLLTHWHLRLDPTNLQAVCGTCHKRIEAYRKRTGDIVGMPETFTDPDHPGAN